jgi:hypothetical protein
MGLERVKKGKAEGKGQRNEGKRSKPVGSFQTGSGGRPHRDNGSTFIRDVGIFL